MTFTPDSHLDRFRIVRRLGAGSMGEVYLAEDPKIDRYVAIKTIRTDDEGPIPTVDLRVRLLREAKAAGRLVHPHIVTLFDVGEINDLIYLVFEYVEGPDLASRLHGSPTLPLLTVANLGCGVCAGLSAAHRHGIVHRDIKPANLLIDKSDAVKISDFGIAKVANQHTSLTQSGSLVGTPQYLSPEQIHGKSTVDERSDLFSLGVVLYELLSGQRPFRGDNLTALIYEVLHREAADISTITNRPIPKELADVVMRLLEKDPRDRYPNGEVLREDLLQVRRRLRNVDSAAPTRVAGVTAQQVSKPRLGRWLRPRPILVGGALAGLITAAGLLLPRLTDNAQQGDASLESGVVSRSGHSVPQQANSLGIPPPRPERPASAGSTSNDLSGNPAAVEPPAGVAPLITSDAEGGTHPAAKRDTPIASRPSSGRLLSVAQGGHINVGGAIAIDVGPDAAAQAAIIKVNGIVRGPAAGSLISLPAGEHRIEVTASGFSPFQFDVSSAAGEFSTVRLSMHR